MSELWIPLGSGDASARGIGPKAALLDRAAAAGLAVPSGGILTAGLPPALPEGLWAVRSAFSAEDQPGRSLAGYFLSLLDVPTAELPAAVAQVRDSASRQPGDFRTDVLLLRMIHGAHAGVAFTEAEFEDDLVELHGSASRPLAKLARWERSRDPEAWRRRLAGLLRQVRRVFGAGDWDIEFADDGRTCWLLQVRPITAAPRRNEAFTLANHKEILPELPSEFMTSLIAAAAPRLFGYYRQFDPELPERRLVIENIARRPLLNLSLLADLMRHWGLPTRLVTQGAGGFAAAHHPLCLPRLLRHLTVLARMARAQQAAPHRAAQLAPELNAQAAAPGATLTATIARLEDHYVALVHQMFALTAAMSFPLALLRACGTLAEHQARHETITTRMLRDWAALPSAEFLGRYGHRGIFESDIARPRYAEQPPPPATAPPNRPPPPRTLRGWLTQPLWALFAAPPLRARELWRHEMMRGFASLRAELLRQATPLLADPADLWDLTVEEARALDAGWRPSTEFLAARREQREQARRQTLPDLVHRFDDPNSWDAAAPGAPTSTLSGLSLTAGSVEGEVLILTEPCWPKDLPATARPILIARAIDAGWIPILARVAGAAIETGGDLSHGSILIREIGLPAVTNIAGLTRHVGAGQRVRLDAAHGRLVLLS